MQGIAVFSPFCQRLPAVTTYYSSIPAHNVKYINKHAALDLIRFTPGGISRAELAERMNLTRAAVTAIVGDLIDSGIIREAESRSGSSGRPPIILEIDPGRGMVAGIDMGATHVSVVLANFSAHVLEEQEVPLDIALGPAACLSHANNLLGGLLEKTGLSKNDILAIGMGVPGPIMADAGTVIAPPIMPGWDQYPIRDSIEETWGCPVSLNNDAELGALGEWAYGAGRGEQNLVFIKVGFGVGAGLLLDGKIYHGATGAAGEIGHLAINENGPVCTCGNRGCLEASTGGKAIASQAQDAVRNGKRTQLSNITPTENITAMDVALAARRGDLISQQILARAGSHLGIAIASLVNLFNPNMVVVGGGVAQIGDLFLEPVRDAVQRRSLPAAAQAVRITTALLGRRSASMGAVVQALSIAMHMIAEGKQSPSEITSLQEGV
jgi:glucokinase-like ROK family protein